MTRIAVISAGLSDPSSTRILADRLAGSASRRLDSAGASTDLDVIELRPLAHAIVDNMLTGFAEGELARAIEAVRRADGLIVVTPVFSASYSGLFKSFIDVLEPGILEAKPVLLAATAGTPRHSLVIDHALRPLFAYLRAEPVPTAVFAATEDFGGPDPLAGRIDRAAGELADRVLGRAGVASADHLPGRGASPGREVPPGNGVPAVATGSFDPDSAAYADFESLLNSSN